jgi:hypothetical protein
MSSDAESIAELATEQIDERGFQGFIRDYGVGGVFAALFLSLIDGISSIGGTIIAPFDALGDALTLLVQRTIGAPTRLISQSIDASIGFWENLGLGPFGFPLAVLSVMVGIYVAVWFIIRIPFSPLIFVRNRLG